MITYGFYNSKDHDRVYDARQFARIFDGIICDGVFGAVGDRFMTTPVEGDIVSVGTGRAWFDGTWTWNDTPYALEMPKADRAQKRRDAIALVVDENRRENRITYYEGTPYSGSNIVYPEIIADPKVHVHILAYVDRPANSNKITEGDILMMIGSEETPFVAGPTDLALIDMDALLGRWRYQLDEFIEKETADFNAWYESVKDIIDSGSLGELTQGTETEEIKRIMVAGFPDGTKVFSDDGLTITATATDKRVLTKVFSSDGLTINSTLVSSSGKEIAKQVKTFSSDGKRITMNLTIYK